MISGFPKAWKPVFTHFIRPKCFKKTKKLLGTSWEDIIFVNMDIKNRKCSKVHVPCFRVFIFQMFLFICGLYHFYIMFYEDEEREMLTFPFKKSSRKINSDVIVFFIFRKRPKNVFYFFPPSRSSVPKKI